jgi:hypothetical protein
MVSSAGAWAATWVSTGEAILPRSDEQHLELAEVAEQFVAEAHDRRCHAHGVHADRSAAAHLLGHREGALEKLVQGGAERARSAGLPHRLLQLPEDLCFADDHRRQAARQPEGVASSARALQHVRVGAKGRGVEAAGLGEPPECMIAEFRRDASFGADVELGAIACRHDRHLGRNP